MEQSMSFEEQEIMRNAYIFLKRHCNPPPSNSDDVVNWWTEAAQEMAAVCTAWNSHPLATGVFIAIYDYISEKAKKKAEAEKYV